MLRQLFKDVTVSTEIITISHSLGVEPDFVHVTPKYTCRWKINIIDPESVVIEFDVPGGNIDVLVIKDHSLIK